MHVLQSKNILLILFFTLNLMLFLPQKNNLFSAKQTIKPGEKAPNIVLFNLKNKLINLRKLKYKKYLLISFSASYCKPCKEELKEFKEIYTKMGKENIDFLLIFIDKEKEEIINFKNDNKIIFAILHDMYKMAMEKYGVAGLPTSFLIDKNGIIRFIAKGYSQANIKKIKEIIK